ncbi:MAG TPA: glycine cleavage system protein GcvH [Bacillota bacterium]
MLRDLKYTPDHQWVKVEGKRIRIGITDYAQQELGDIVFIDLPGAWERVDTKGVMVTIESVKSATDFHAPVSGEVVEVNEALKDSPELVNQDPYHQGWLVIIEPSHPQELKNLLTAAEYTALIGK